jgi:carbonic anhydrase
MEVEPVMMVPLAPDQETCHPLPLAATRSFMTDFAALIQGYHRFRVNGWENQRKRWAELSQGQAPKLMVIACSDSRVDPSSVFDTSPGEMFVARNVANLVPPFEADGGRHGVSAALEFAVTQLEVPEIVVLGHGGCGGIAAALTRRFDGCAPGEGGFIAHWIDLLDEARDKVLHDHGPEATAVLEREGIKVSLANLRTFPCIRKREKAGLLKLHGALFAIDDGILHVLDEVTGAFSPA